MKASVGITVLLLLISNACIAQDYYWIGDGGDWKDVAHWSLTSGGTSAGVVPGAGNNVYFDGNSFILPDQVVTISDDGTDFGVYVKGMDWRGVTNNPTFQIRTITSNWISNAVYGSVYFDENMTLDFLNVEFYLASPSNYEFDSKGHDLGEGNFFAINFDYDTGTGLPVVCNLLSDLNTAYLYIKTGTLRTNGHAVKTKTAGYLQMASSPGNAIADFTGSVVDIVGGTVLIGGASSIIDDNAEIIMRGTTFTSGPQNFNHFTIAGNNVSLTGTTSHTFQTLEILPKGKITLNSGVQTINTLIANGSVFNPATIVGGTIQKSSGIVNISGASLTNTTATGGATFRAINSTDGGGNTGWTFITDTQDYYWVGDGGNWKDPAHWSLTSGGASSGVIPGISNNVRFDENSFSLPGQVVYILDNGSLEGVDFKTMDWRGVANSPTFQIKAVTSDWIGNTSYGSLYFDPNMTLDFNAAEFYMQGSSDYDFDTQNHYMGQNSFLFFSPTANNLTGQVLSDINHAWIYVGSGTFNLNGHTFIGQSDTNYPSLWLGGNVSTPVVADVSNSTIDIGTLQISAYSTLIDDNSVMTIRKQLNASGQDFNHIRAISLTQGGNGTANIDNTFQTLELLPGSTVKFFPAAIQTVTNLIISGNTSNPITLSSTSPGMTTTISKPAGTVDAKYVHLKDIAATGGATFNATNSWNDGGNTGWTFTYDNPPNNSLMNLISSHQIKSQDASSWSSPQRMTIDANDNLVVVGYYEGTIDFDPGVGEKMITDNSDYEEPFLAKYTSTGALAWVYTFPAYDYSTDYYEIEGVVTDASGNILTGGEIRGTADVDPGTGVTSLTSSNGEDGEPVFTKLDANGNLMWTKQLYFSPTNYGSADIDFITIDAANNILIVGTFYAGTLDVDPGAPTVNLTTSDNDNDIYLAKYDANGNYTWAVTIGEFDNYEYPEEIITDSQNNIYISYQNDEGSEGSGSTVRKYSPIGNLLWTISSENTWIEGYNSMKIDEANNKLYTVGESNSDDDDGDPLVFNGTTGSSTLPAGSGFVAVYNLNGALVNVIGFESSNDAYPVSINILQDGNLLVTGGFEGNIDMDPSSGTFEQFYEEASFMVKITPAGDFIWGASLPGSEGMISQLNSLNELVGMVIMDDGETVDVDPGTGVTNISSVGEDIIIVRYNVGASTVAAADQLALEAFYQATGGPDWKVKTNWLSGEVNDWFGVTVVNYKITGITLPDNNLTGTITQESLMLPNLATLDLSSNQLVAIPDLSSLTSLTTLNVSNNKLDFSSLEKNAAILGINYLSQADLGTALDTLVAVGSPAKLKLATGGTTNAYQWKRNGQDIAGATSSSYQIEEIGRSNMGDYTLEITNTSVPGLTLKSATQRATAVANVSGKLQLNASTPVTNGEMLLLKINPGGVGYDTTRIQSVQSDGTYLLDKIVLDDYVMVGLGDLVQYKDYFPTYFDGSVFWEEATRIELNENRVGLDITLSPLPSAHPVGDGELFGTLSVGDLGPGGRTQKDRIIGAGASVRRGTKTGRPTETLEGEDIVAFLYTNENGEFDFKDLEEGSYILNIQYPGVPMDKESDIYITLGPKAKRQNVQKVEALAEAGKITVKRLIIVGIEEKGEEQVKVYPNPVAEELFIEMEQGSGEGIAVLTDTMGREYKRIQVLEEMKVMNVRDLTSGIYVLTIHHQGQQISRSKIVIK